MVVEVRRPSARIVLRARANPDAPAKPKTDGAAREDDQPRLHIAAYLMISLPGKQTDSRSKSRSKENSNGRDTAGLR